MKKTASLVLVVLLAISVVLNLYQISQRTSQRAVTSAINATSAPSVAKSQYSLLSTQIQTESENDLLVRFIDLRQKLRDYVTPFGDNFSFYFEYLPTGENIGVNDRVEFDPASLLKVPLAIAYYNNIEDSGTSLNQIATIQQQDIDNRFGDLWKKGVGAQLSLDDVVKIMLTDSDNTAALILTRYVPEKAYEDVYNGLDITYVGDKKFKITTKGYSSILKSLYYSSIVNMQHSQLILSYLTNSDFNSMLVAGVPSNVTVAHKIGVIDNTDNHDCGIVYIPKRPYILCMFSKANTADSSDRMKAVSKIVYDYVSSQ